MGEQVLEKRKRVLGPRHPETQWSMDVLARTWHGRGAREKALQLMLECYELRKQTAGINHPHTRVCATTVEEWQGD
jgi:hypothetical protein